MNTTPREQQLTEDIMRRVHFIHGLRVLMSPGMIRASVFLASLVATIFLVSIPHCLTNMSHLSAAAYIPYVAQAYLQTSFVVQAVLLLATAAGAWFVVDIVRNVRYSRMVMRTA